MIYTITTIRHNAHSLPFHEGHRNVGYYLSEAEARNALAKGWGELNEDGYYPTAVIEEYKPGLYPQPKVIAWFSYEVHPTASTKKQLGWKECAMPEECKVKKGIQVGGFVMG